MYLNTFLIICLLVVYITQQPSAERCPGPINRHLASQANATEDEVKKQFRKFAMQWCAPCLHVYAIGDPACVVSGLGSYNQIYSHG